MDARLAERMSRAGFYEIEVGLQSIHPVALRKIHRRFQPVKFLEGVRLLQEHGIEVMVDLIAGLPGDTAIDIEGSIDWVLEKEAYDSLMLYPLSLMPSTELRQRAGDMGLVSMFPPPYLLTRNHEIDARGMIQAFRYYEKQMEEDISPLEMPLSVQRNEDQERALNGLIHRVEWRNSGEVSLLRRIGNRTAYSLSVGMSPEVIKSPEVWTPVIRDYLDENPFSLLSVEVPGSARPAELEPLWEIARRHHHPGDRDYTVTHTPFRSFVVFSREGQLTWKWPDPREAGSLQLHDGQSVKSEPVCLVKSGDEKLPDWFIRRLAERYDPIPKIRFWETPEAEELEEPGSHD
jgi:hypothetical protein